MARQITNTSRCRAMVDAGIEDPNSQEGIDFCTKQCPYPDKCVIFEGSFKSVTKMKIEARAREAKKLYATGMSMEDIAEHFKVTTRTTRRDLAGLL